MSLVAAALGVAYAYAPALWVATIIGFGLFTCIYILVAFVIAVYVPELFPTEYRLRGTGVCTTVGRVSSVIVPYAVVALFAAGGIGFVLALLVGMLLLQALVVAVAGVETNLRSLETWPRRAPRQSEHSRPDQGRCAPLIVPRHCFVATLLAMTAGRAPGNDRRHRALANDRGWAASAPRNDSGLRRAHQQRA